MSFVYALYIYLYRLNPIIVMENNFMQITSISYLPRTSKWLIEAIWLNTRQRTVNNVASNGLTTSGQQATTWIKSLFLIGRLGTYFIEFESKHKYLLSKTHLLSDLLYAVHFDSVSFC